MPYRLLPRLYALLNTGRFLQAKPLEQAYLAAFFAYKRYIEDPFAALSRRHPEVFFGGDVIDVGANVGYTATVFARVVGSGHRVYAFEPEPTNFRRLGSIVRRRNLSAVIVPVCSAVADFDGKGQLILNPSHPGDHRLHGVVAEHRAGAAVAVPVVSLDRFTAEREIGPVAFVKIDVQGAELAVSRGMRGLIERSPSLAVAFEYSSGTSTELLEFYRNYGFRLYLIERSGRLREADDAAIGAVSRLSRGYTDVLARQTARRY